MASFFAVRRIFFPFLFAGIAAAQVAPPPPPPPGAQQGTIMIRRADVAPAGATADVEFIVGGAVGDAANGAFGGRGGAGANAQRTPEQEIRIAGRVSSVTGEPLSKAEVRLLPANLQIVAALPAGMNLPGMVSTVTDDSGAYELTNVLPGAYQLMAARNGFVQQRYGARTPGGSGTPITVKDADRLTKIDVQMTPQAVLTGQVLDQDGDPVVGVTVRASHYSYFNGQRQLRSEGANVNTDDRGVYRIPGLMPGRYYIQASSRIQPGATTANVDTFFPSSLDLRGATPVDVMAGAEMSGMTIRLRREKVYSIRGVAIDRSSGAPVANSAVMLLPNEASGAAPDSITNVFSQQQRTDRQGKFEIRGVLPGSYTMYGSMGGTVNISLNNGGQAFVALATTVSVNGGPNPAQTSLSGSLPVTVAAEDLELTLPMGPGETISGALRVENGSMEDLRKAAGPGPQNAPAQLRIAGLGGGLAVRLNPTQGVAVNTPGGPIKDDGTFELTGAAASKYYATVAGLPRGYYVKQMSMGGQDATRVPLDVSNGGGRLDVLVAKGMGQVTGTVSDSQGRPLSGVTVSLWPQTPDNSTANGGVRITTTDQNGSYSFTEVKPGEYRAAAFDDLPDTGLAQYAAFLGGFTGEAQSFKLDPDGTEAPQLKPVSEARITQELAKLP